MLFSPRYSPPLAPIFIILQVAGSKINWTIPIPIFYVSPFSYLLQAPSVHFFRPAKLPLNTCIFHGLSRVCYKQAQRPNKLICQQYQSIFCSLETYSSTTSTSIFILQQKKTVKKIIVRLAVVPWALPLQLHSQCYPLHAIPPLWLPFSLFYKSQAKDYLDNPHPHILCIALFLPTPSALRPLFSPC